MINIELIRLFKRKSFYVALFIGLSIACLEAFSNGNIRLKADDFIDFSNGVYNNLMLYSIGEYTRILQMIFPLIITISFADTYLEDLKSGFIKNIITRYDKKKYLTIRFWMNFIVSGIVISIPFLVNYMLYAAFIPSIEPKVFFSSTLDFRTFLANIYFEYPLLHVFIRIMLLFIYGGAFSSIALASSILFKNKYVITIIPFIIYNAMDVLFGIIFKYSYSPRAFLFTPTEYNPMFVIVPIVLIISSFCIFTIGGLRNELS